jgi:plastocyanin
MRVLLTGAVSAVGAAALLSGCGGGNGNPASPSSAGASVTVNIVANTGSTAYNPNPVAASVGQTLAFRNSSSEVHHIVLDDGSADFGTLSPGQTGPAVTVKAGGATFHCTNHSSMVGAINGEVPEPPPCTNPGYC